MSSVEDSEVVAAGSTENSTVASDGTGSIAKRKCLYGKKCSSHSVSHRAKFYHPGEDGPVPVSSEDKRREKSIKGTKKVDPKVDKSDAAPDKSVAKECEPEEISTDEPTEKPSKKATEKTEKPGVSEKPEQSDEKSEQAGGAPGEKPSNMTTSERKQKKCLFGRKCHDFSAFHRGKYLHPAPAEASGTGDASVKKEVKEQKSEQSAKKAKDTAKDDDDSVETPSVGLVERLELDKLFCKKGNDCEDYSDEHKVYCHQEIMDDVAIARVLVKHRRLRLRFTITGQFLRDEYGPYDYDNKENLTSLVERSSLLKLDKGSGPKSYTVELCDELSDVVNELTASDSAKKTQKEKAPTSKEVADENSNAAEVPTSSSEEKIDEKPTQEDLVKKFALSKTYCSFGTECNKMEKPAHMDKFQHLPEISEWAIARVMLRNRVSKVVLARAGMLCKEEYGPIRFPPKSTKLSQVIQDPSEYFEVTNGLDTILELKQRFRLAGMKGGDNGDNKQTAAAGDGKVPSDAEKQSETLDMKNAEAAEDVRDDDSAAPGADDKNEQGKSAFLIKVLRLSDKYCRHGSSCRDSSLDHQEQFRHLKVINDRAIARVMVKHDLTYGPMYKVGGLVREEYGTYAFPSGRAKLTLVLNGSKWVTLDREKEFVHAQLTPMSLKCLNEWRRLKEPNTKPVPIPEKRSTPEKGKDKVEDKECENNIAAISPASARVLNVFDDVRPPSRVPFKALTEDAILDVFRFFNVDEVDLASLADMLARGGYMCPATTNLKTILKSAPNKFLLSQHSHNGKSETTVKLLFKKDVAMNPVRTAVAALACAIIHSDGDRTLSYLVNALRRSKSLERVNFEEVKAIIHGLPNVFVVTPMPKAGEVISLKVRIRPPLERNTTPAPTAAEIAAATLPGKDGDEMPSRSSTPTKRGKVELTEAIVLRIVRKKLKDRDGMPLTEVEDALNEVMEWKLPKKNKNMREFLNGTKSMGWSLQAGVHLRSARSTQSSPVRKEQRSSEEPAYLDVREQKPLEGDEEEACRAPSMSPPPLSSGMNGPYRRLLPSKLIAESSEGASVEEAIMQQAHQQHVQMQRHFEERQRQLEEDLQVQYQTKLQQLMQMERDLQAKQIEDANRQRLSEEEMMRHHLQQQSHFPPAMQMQIGMNERAITLPKDGAPQQMPIIFSPVRSMGSPERVRSPPMGGYTMNMHQQHSPLSYKPPSLFGQGEFNPEEVASEQRYFNSSMPSGSPMSQGEGASFSQSYYDRPPSQASNGYEIESTNAFQKLANQYRHTEEWRASERSNHGSPVMSFNAYPSDGFAKGNFPEEDLGDEGQEDDEAILHEIVELANDDPWEDDNAPDEDLEPDGSQTFVTSTTEQCAICYDGDANTILSPCSHLACEVCVAKIRKMTIYLPSKHGTECPFCRTKVQCWLPITTSLEEHISSCGKCRPPSRSPSPPPVAIENSDSSVANTEQPPAPQRERCKYFQSKTGCQNSKCKFLHEAAPPQPSKEKTVKCKYHYGKMGCLNGSKCPFYHSESERVYLD